MYREFCFDGYYNPELMHGPLLQPSAHTHTHICMHASIHTHTHIYIYEYKPSWNLMRRNLKLESFVHTVT